MEPTSDIYPSMTQVAPKWLASALLNDDDAPASTTDEDSSTTAHPLGFV